MNLLSIFGSKASRIRAKFAPTVKRINALEDEYKALSDAELKRKTTLFKQRLADGATLESLTVEAFAAVREAARRAMGTPHYDVQLLGGLVLNSGRITEMKTGEGKTQVAALAAYLNSLTGQGVHVVTVNDYLAKRDAEWMSQIYSVLGLTCAAIYHGQTPSERRDAYAADVTYATNNELGFDYLRDNMAFDPRQLVQRPLNFAIVDEVDSILIDEARTPLIISGPTEDKTPLYMAIDKLMPKFGEDDFIKDEKQNSVTLTDAGIDKAEKLLIAAKFMEEGDSLYDIQHIQLVHHVNQALRAHQLFKRDDNYIVHEGEIVIIDEFTGRMMPGRRYGEGLHQAIEAKEGVNIKAENQTLASITFQNYFRLYDKLSGMTGTALTEAEEFEQIYGLQVVDIPTNVPIARKDATDIIYPYLENKMKAILADIKECHAKGQPLLIGTTTIEKSEELSKLLKKEKIPHRVLNARQHEHEAEIVSQAGRKGAVTIATNMAGRGTDIKLGGNLELLLAEAKTEAEKKKIKAEHEKEKAEVMAAGGLRVIGTERHESRRIDNQLRGRSGRQGDVGSSVFYISLQDDLMRIFAKGLDQLAAKMDIPPDKPVQNKIIGSAIQTAQKRIEGRNFDIRKHLLKFDDVLNEQRKVIYTQRRELLESARVDDIIEDFREEALEELFARCFPTGSHEDQWQLDLFEAELHQLFNIKPKVRQWLEKDHLSPEDAFEKLKDLQVKTWAEKRKRYGDMLMSGMEKGILLQTLDRHWKDHLQRLQNLQQGITLRGYAQKDPVNEYKSEAFSMFSEVLTQTRDETIQALSHQEISSEELEAIQAQQRAMAQMQNQAADAASAAVELDPNGAQAALVGDKAAPASGYDPYAHMNLSRNALCPCGSGRRYKHCHGKLEALKSA